MKKKLSLVLAALIVALALFGCASAEKSDTDTSAATDAAESAEQSSDAEADAEEATGGKITIVFAIDNLTDTYMRSVADGFLAWGEENSDIVETTVLDAEADITKQMTNIENAITQGADAIVLKPVDSCGCTNMATACEEANIPLVTVTQDTNDEAMRRTYIGTGDHKYAGELQATYIDEQLNGEGNACVLIGDLGHEVSVNRTDGVLEYLEANCPNIKILDQQIANWMRDDAIAVVEDWLNSEIGADIDVIFANNDEMAIGAILACEEAGRDDILITGVDGLVEGLTYLKEGRLAFTVFQNGTAQGENAAKVAYGYTQGETFDSIIDIPYEPVFLEDVDAYLARFQ